MRGVITYTPLHRRGKRRLLPVTRKGAFAARALLKIVREPLIVFLGQSQFRRPEGSYTHNQADNFRRLLRSRTGNA
jgi:hypothetical protein